MEFQVATDVFDEILEYHMNNKELCRYIKEKVRAEVNYAQTTGLSTTDSIAYSGDYVISFSKDYDSPLMWSAYSDYTGYCMQFDFDKLLNELLTVPDTGFLHGEVVYDHEIQRNLLEETIVRSYFKWPISFGYIKKWEDLDQLTDEEIDHWVKYVAVEISAYNMFFKLPCFEGEHEYRFVFMVGHDGGRYKLGHIWKHYFRVKDEVLIPFIKVPLKSLDSIERVLIGSKK